MITSVFYECKESDMLHAWVHGVGCGTDSHRVRVTRRHQSGSGHIGRHALLY